ncbi:hypothetical protein D9V29_07300 [Mycetocola manganoxydans]|uniref:Uncharacterized protein n=1 Tax=Mycetocola manganoxydans TaxID=699879 RepID=A0A3L6ZUT8_9MICO|nr:hypothetical protein [Mycetocola manganoxydans]RLP71654.1 hypothetical protein D9V29_07300 [Mycetocola manganoxydans]GHD38883.1 hypothetical protein GCM10008097_00980 [Mycetocola manganoxydans]
MTNTFSLEDSAAMADLRTYLARARVVDDTAVRLIAAGGVLAVYAAVLYPRGLLDSSPTILGLRTFAETSGAVFDRVVPPAAISDRLAALESSAGAVQVSLPDSDVRTSWSGIAPPRGAWEQIGSVSSVVLELVARDGAGEVARAVPENTGDLLVQRVRSDVWSRPLSESQPVPAGLAFAAASLGFLVGEEEVPLFVSGQWLRASPVRGHVLVRSGRG